MARSDPPSYGLGPSPTPRPRGRFGLDDQRTTLLVAHSYREAQLWASQHMHHPRWRYVSEHHQLQGLRGETHRVVVLGHPPGHAADLIRSALAHLAATGTTIEHQERP